jgi:methyl-accepting chemotaxis protein
MNFSRLKIQTRLQISFGLILLSLLGMTLLAGFANSNSSLLIGFGIITLLVGTALAWMTLRSISGPLNEAVDISRRIASGDLRNTFDVQSEDELSEILCSLQSLCEQLFQVVVDVRYGTVGIATTSNFIKGDNTALSSRTESQASSLEETASSMEELTSTVKQNADNAKQANQLVNSAAQLAAKGGDVVSDVVNTMGSIKESSRKIVDIISVIDGIAFQTNILALNAAVEAARAGEQGRGFAVVAAEVRSLAQRSASAAKEIKALIVDSVEKVDAGGKLVDDAGKTMSEIVASVKRVADIMSEIAAASAEQSAGIDEINRAVIQIDGMTQQNATLVEAAATTAAGLEDQAMSLSKSVSAFELGEREFGTAEEAQAMVERALEFIRANGKEAGMAAISDPHGPFIDRDLFLGMCDATCKIIANGGNARLIGIDGSKVKDVDGKYFVLEMQKITRTQGAGWCDYKYVHPLTKQICVKSAYAAAVGFDDLFISCGFYKKID